MDFRHEVNVCFCCEARRNRQRYRHLEFIRFRNPVAACRHYIEPGVRAKRSRRKRPQELQAQCTGIDPRAVVNKPAIQIGKGPLPGDSLANFSQQHRENPVCFGLVGPAMLA
jgi:hypothetical protein